MTPRRPDYQAGSARVNGTTGAIVGSQSGYITNSVRTGTGVYELTIASADPAEHTARAQVIRTNGDKITATVEWVSDTLIRVRTVRIA